MTRVKIADLKNNLSRYLLTVRDGGALVVLDRDTPVARIVPFDRPTSGKDKTDPYWTEERLSDLERRGTIARGNHRDMPAWARDRRPTKLPAGAPGAVNVLLQMRRESTR